ncbi:MAG: hypothetical protein O3B08_15005 [Proteobacteria bacterium]|jgi:hypothetical protein|nr:hypothetical protein [Pseudomonadota bacterium]
MIIRVLPLLAVLLLASSCYVPAKFEADLNIDESGKFAFRYNGNLLAVTLLRKLSFGEVTKENLAENAAIYERDLARDSGFKKIKHLEGAMYGVEFDRQGDIVKERTFSFVRSNALFLGVKRRKDGLIEVFGSRPPKNLVDALIDYGFDVRGVFRVWTNAKVVSHNAQQSREEGSPKVYQWRIQSMRDTPPSLILELK